MTLSTRAVDIIRHLHHQFITLAEGTDDDRRALTLKMAEQLRFELGPGWGTKKSGPTNPPSKDAIAYTADETNDQAPMDVWDWQNGTTRAPMVQAGDGPAYPGLTGQRFIRVLPVDHLAVATVPTSTPSPTPTPTPPADLAAVLVRLGELDGAIATALAEIVRRVDAVALAVNVDRTATGRVGGWAGGPVTLTITKG